MLTNTISAGRYFHMAETTHCHTHGDCEQTFVCSHLTEGTAGLGFNRGEPSDDDPLPNAWCEPERERNHDPPF